MVIWKIKDFINSFWLYLTFIHCTVQLLTYSITLGKISLFHYDMIGLIIMILCRSFCFFLGCISNRGWGDGLRILYNKVDSLNPIPTKGGFFSESAICFSNLQKKYSKKLSWTWNLNFPPITVNNKFKFQVQNSNLEDFFWRFEKQIAFSE